jgi:hypothetical protein
MGGGRLDVLWAALLFSGGGGGRRGFPIKCEYGVGIRELSSAWPVEDRVIPKQAVAHPTSCGTVGFLDDI